MLDSSRHVRVAVDGATVAESRRTRILLETGLPPRYYLPKPEVDMRHLRPLDVVTRCPYKGVADRHWSVVVEGDTVEDAAWCYEHPAPEAAGIAGRIAFLQERVDVWVDGELLEPPETP